MSFRRLPSRVLQTTKALVKAKLIEEPRWLKAAEKHPNTDNFLRCSHPIAYDSPLPSENRKRSTATTMALSSCVPIRGKVTMRKTRFRPPTPPRIVYPEDKLRRRFFKDHPFELARPVCLIEKDGRSESNWDKVLAADKSFRITNEDIIKAQLKLISQGFSRAEAYERVTKELSLHRVHEETENMLAQNQAKIFGARLRKDAIELGIEAEERNLELSRKVIALKNALRNTEEFVSEKSFKEQDESSAALQ